MSLPEKAWQAQVVELAQLYGWWVYHPYDSRRSEPGWPDCTFARVPEFFLAELKTDRGRLSPAQRRCIALLLSCGLEVNVWRPRDFEAVHARLRR